MGSSVGAIGGRVNIQVTDNKAVVGDSNTLGPDFQEY
jgi:hypothetical protein